MVLLVEGPDTHPHWARCVIPRGIALACVAMGAAFSSLRPGPVLRAMFFVDFVTMLGSESAVHVYLSALSPRSKRVLLLLILLVDTSTLVAMLTELPEGWAAAIGRVLLFWLVRVRARLALNPHHSPFTLTRCCSSAWPSVAPPAAGPHSYQALRGRWGCLRRMSGATSGMTRPTTSRRSHPSIHPSTRPSIHPRALHARCMNTARPTAYALHARCTCCMCAGAGRGRATAARALASSARAAR